MWVSRKHASGRQRDASEYGLETFKYIGDWCRRNGHSQLIGSLTALYSSAKTHWLWLASSGKCKRIPVKRLDVWVKRTNRSQIQGTARAAARRRQVNLLMQMGLLLVGHGWVEPVCLTEVLACPPPRRIKVKAAAYQPKDRRAFARIADWCADNGRRGIRYVLAELYDKACAYVEKHGGHRGQRIPSDFDDETLVRAVRWGKQRLVAKRNARQAYLRCLSTAGLISKGRGWLCLDVSAPQKLNGMYTGVQTTFLDSAGQNASKPPFAAKNAKSFLSKGQLQLVHAVGSSSLRQLLQAEPPGGNRFDGPRSRRGQFAKVELSEPQNLRADPTAIARKPPLGRPCAATSSLVPQKSMSAFRARRQQQAHSRWVHRKQTEHEAACEREGVYEAIAELLGKEGPNPGGQRTARPQDSPPGTSDSARPLNLCPRL